MSVAFSPKAERDLEDIADYIAKDSPQRALSFIDELEAACQSLATAPLGHQPLPHIHPDIRRAVHNRYLIFYSVRNGEVRIERILHHARDITEDSFAD